MKTVLVTGGMGFIGGHLVELLLESNYQVIVVDNRQAGCLIVEHPSVRYVHDSVIGQTVTKDVEHIVHLAAWSNVRESMKKPFRLYADNVMTTASLIGDILEGGLKVKSCVFASSSAVESPESHYGVSKMASEAMLQVFQAQTGIPCALLRFANVYGPRQSPIHGTLISNLVTCVMTGNSPSIYGDGSQERDYIYVGDVVAAIIASMSAGISGVMNASTGKSISVNSVVAAARDAAIPMGLTLPDAAYENAIAGDKQTVSMVSDGYRRLGWRPCAPLRLGIQEQIKWAKAMKGSWEDNHHPDGSIVT